MTFKVILSKDADKNILKLLKAGDKQALKKIETLLEELERHPYEGTGKPKPLGGNRSGQWSRHVSDKHRLVYKVEDEILTVLVFSVSSHYGDK